MTVLYLKRAIQDILQNRFLNFVTIITISLSILIVSSAILFFINAGQIIALWQKGIRIMAYLKPEMAATALPGLTQDIQALDGVDSVRFISRDEALAELKAQMKRQSFLFENLAENPLPDGFEIRMDPSAQTWKNIEAVAARVEAFEPIAEVEYGQRWLGRFSRIFDLFRLAGYAMGGLFFIATVFIVANTIRLIIYSRREELEITRLVGATDRFIKIPFYIEGLIQGALGAICGLAILFFLFVLLSSNVEEGFFSDLFQIRFLSPGVMLPIVLGSALVGWLGCHLSLKQFLKV
ncbi:MAG: ABC transporter permease [Desulfobacterales bacterium]|nr:MAG: ABC transporter permease [Desulfobacterales bacterium]